MLCGRENRPWHMPIFVLLCGFEKLPRTDLVDDGGLFLSVRAPQQENDARRIIADPTDDGICQFLPAFALV